MREQIEQDWVVQLYKEFKSIVWERSLSLRRPVIDLCDHQSLWGSWEPETRRLSLNRKLISDHSWAVVIEVLKHEMAHMMVDEMYQVDEPPHGPYFKKCCQKLGIMPWASVREEDLPRSLKEDSGEGKDPEALRLLRKVEKLLALAESSNEHEAYLAMQQVQKLYSRYNLSYTQVSEHTRWVLRLRKKRITAEVSGICSILCAYFFVEVVYSREYDQKDLCKYRTVVILGRRHNVKMAEYVFHFLRRSLDSLWRDYKKAQSCPGYHRLSFQLGVIKGFREKLNREVKASTEGGRHFCVACPDDQALILMDRSLDEFTNHVFPRLGKRARSSASLDRNAYSAGVVQGRELVLHRGIEKKGEGSYYLQ